MIYPLSESKVTAKTLNVVIVDVHVHLRDPGQVLQVVRLVARLEHERLSVLEEGLNYSARTPTALVKSCTVHAIRAKVAQVTSDLLRNDAKDRTVAFVGLL